MVDIFTILEAFRLYKKNFSDGLNIPNLVISVSDEDKLKIYKHIDNYFIQTTYHLGGFDYVYDVCLPWAIKNRRSIWYKLEHDLKKSMIHTEELEEEIKKLLDGKKINPQGIFPRDIMLIHKEPIKNIVDKYENKRSWLLDL